MLVQATSGFIESHELDFEEFVEIVTIWSRICRGSGPRIQRLYESRVKFKHHITHVLGIIYFAHEVELAAHSTGLMRLPRQERQSAAVLRVAEALDVQPNVVAAEHRKSKNYILLAQDGPGTLLQVGISTDYM